MSRTAQHKQPTKSAVTDLSAIVSHPTRRRCWSALLGRMASPKQLADEFGLSTHHVSYHMTKLEKLGAIELVYTRPVRGATEHFYRTAERYHLREDDVKALSTENSTANLTHIFQLEMADIAAGLDGGKMTERTDHVVARHPLVLDDEGWTALAELFEETTEKVYELQRESVERAASDPERRDIHAMAHINYFEMPDRDDRVKQF